MSILKENVFVFPSFRILQMYILKEEAGTMTSDFRDRAKVNNWPA